MWCHVLLFALPVLGLALFFILPWGQALPVYVAIVLLSIVLYRETARVLRLPVQTGPEGMEGIEGFALTDIRWEGVVRVRGETWKAVSREPIAAGEKIRLLRVEGVRAVVERTPRPGE